MKTSISLFLITSVFFFMLACDKEVRDKDITLVEIDIESIADEADLEEVEIDREVFADGNESLKITTDNPLVIQLANTGDIDVEDALLLYRAKIKTKDLKGSVYLEMWCSFGQKGQFFSKAIEKALSGTNDWTMQEAPFFLKKGENPDDIKLNLVVNGKGTVWLDQIELLRKPLKNNVKN